MVKGRLRLGERQVGLWLGVRFGFQRQLHCQPCPRRREVARETNDHHQTARTLAGSSRPAALPAARPARPPARRARNHPVVGLSVEPVDRVGVAVVLVDEQPVHQLHVHACERPGLDQPGVDARVQPVERKRVGRECGGQPGSPPPFSGRRRYGRLGMARAAPRRIEPAAASTA